MTKLIYIAGKYRAATEHEVYQNIQTAREWAMKWCQVDGWYPVTPHMNSAFFGGLCDDHKFLEGGLEMLRRCDAIFMIPGWEDSVGSKAEHYEAMQLGIRVFYELPNGEEQ